MTVSSANNRRVAFTARSIFLRSDSFGGTALLALLIIAGVLALLVPEFLTPSNLLNVGRQASVLVIVACGMTMVILSGNIDLSVGSAVALCTVVGASLSGNVGLNAPATVLAMIALGAFIGAIKGGLVAWARINSFIVTLGLMTVLRGAALTFTGGYPIAGVPDGVRYLGFGVAGGVPLPLIVSIVVFVLVALLLSKTVFGRHIYAIGGNETSSHIAGVPVAFTKFLVFVISGAFCGVAAVVLLGRLGAGLPTSAQGMELDAIAAVILGGASLFGGRGSVFGTLFGALILAFLQNGLNLMGVNSFIIQILSGAIIILAVLLDRFRAGKTT
ncbi:MAG TPA: ABC transporter permease [Roseiarcus sp.]|jgi:ribose transport system permease protein